MIYSVAAMFILASQQGECCLILNCEYKINTSTNKDDKDNNRSVTFTTNSIIFCMNEPWSVTTMK